MPWKTTAALIAIAPFALLWAAFVAAETAKAAAVVKGGRNG